MPNTTLDKNLKKALLDARLMIDDLAKAEGNEAETSRRIERMFETILGYDSLKHITCEYAVHGAGDTDYCDFAIKVGPPTENKPVLLVEVKGIGVDLASRHIKQTASYAINLGCEWALLTNAREWRLYHVSFNQPPETTMVESWNLLDDDLVALAEQFGLLSLKNLRQNGLTQLWQKRNLLSAANILGAILSQDSLNLLRRQLKKYSAVSVSPEDIVGSVRRLLNETALTELEALKISLPKKKAVKKVASPANGEIKAAENACPSPVQTETKIAES